MFLIPFLLGIWNSAWAYFQNGSLIQVVYKNDDVEVATDLLDLRIFDLRQQNVALTSAGTVAGVRFWAPPPASRAITRSWGQDEP